MGHQSKNSHQGLINRILSDMYSGMQDAGLINQHIPAGLHTADYDLPYGDVVRIKEEKNRVYYNIFRAK